MSLFVSPPVTLGNGARTLLRGADDFRLFRLMSPTFFNEAASFFLARELENS